jgi:hypothetical protein
MLTQQDTASQPLENSSLDCFLSFELSLSKQNVNYHRLAVALAISLERGTMFVKPLKNARARQSGA